MPAVVIQDVLRKKCPGLCLGVLTATATNAAHDAALWAQLKEEAGRLRQRQTLDDIHRHPAIAAVREAYKRCGKNPTRYRPAAEALRRRIVKGQGLSPVCNLVDIINLVSLRSGFCIGGFDADAVRGNPVWGIGQPDEPFEAIGRGPLNIAGMPAVRDEQGAIGTPSSDSVRTRITLETQRVMLIVNAYDGAGGVEEALQHAEGLLTEYTSGRAFVAEVVQ
jgi:DNA/RNA-binding domain of Phe-tRNA-synthetase-like protein